MYRCKQHKKSSNAFINLLFMKMYEAWFEKLGFTFFSYNKFFSNGEYFTFNSSDMDKLEFCFETLYKGIEWSDYTLWKEIKLNSDGDISMISWSPFKKTPLILALSKIISSIYRKNKWQKIISNGFSFYRIKEDKSIEFWHFAIDEENHQMQSIYINKPYLIKQLVLEFNYKIAILFDPSNIFIKTYKETLNNYILRSKRAFMNQDNYRIPIPRKFIDEIKKNIDEHKFYIENKGKSIKLSKRQAECLQLLALGKTYDQISTDLAIAKSVVEDHIEQIKKKTNFYHRSQLIECTLRNQWW